MLSRPNASDRVPVGPAGWVRQQRSPARRFWTQKTRATGHENHYYYYYYDYYYDYYYCDYYHHYYYCYYYDY
eukprot:1180635-Pyramimonas_sp.AAC.1